MMARFYLTTAIDYVNSRPHLGTAYEKIAADVIARYRRLCGVPTHFVMGNDEHSQNVYQRAKEQGLEPLAFCDQMEQVFRQVWAKLDVSFDDFIRTTEDRHESVVQAFLQKLYDTGFIYDGEYEGFYCVGCEEFKTEAEIMDYARIYDPQPFHIDPEAAAASIYGGIIASGLQTVAIAFAQTLRANVFNEASMGSPGMDAIRWL